MCVHVASEQAQVWVDVELRPYCLDATVPLITSD